MNLLWNSQKNIFQLSVAVRNINGMRGWKKMKLGLAKNETLRKLYMSEQFLSKIVGVKI